MTIQLHIPVPAWRAPRTALALFIAACFTGAGAAPTDPVVIAGQATFSQQGNVFSITNTPNTVINWKSFSVNAGDVTRFIQQSADSAVLNRITGQDPSRILGALQSNGHVFLINPNGVMFGKDSRVDVNGLTASTLDLKTADFLAGKNNFKAGKHAGAIVNQGSITTPAGGHVFLIATDVKNSGVITSPQGQVVLAAGRSVQLVDSSNPDLHVVVSAPADQAVNLGQIIAQGGKVGIYGALVSQRGVVNANSAQVGANGKIVLRASRDAMLEAGSVTTATGVGSGGQVSVEGRRVGMVGDARIDVSGATGGGSVLLGGGYQGKSPLLANAQQTLMGKDASIRADAINSGNGGTVVLWGDQSTRATGAISAQGGAVSGNGGLVETSGKQLEVNGIRVNAGARNGAAGTWLLDPYDITVTLSGTAGLSNVDQFGDGGSSSAQIHPNTINSVAAGTNVVLQATHDVTIANAISPALGASGSLTIDAGNNINLNAPVSTGGGTLTLAANHPGYASGNGGVVASASAAINTGGGNLFISGVQADLSSTIATGGGGITANTTSYIKFGQNVSTSNGPVALNSGYIDFGGIGTSFSSGSGIMQLKSNGFALASGWVLSSQSFIDVITDAATLQGSFGGVGTIRPSLSFSPYTTGNGVTLTNGTGSGLLIDPAKLASYDVDGIVIGSNTTGNINVFAPYSGGLAKYLTLTGQGNIYVANPITMPAGSGSALLLSIDGNSNSVITLKAPVAADSVYLTAGAMSIEAGVTGTGVASRIKIAPNAVTGGIALGVGAADGNGTLALDDTEVANLNALSVQIGGNAGQAGAVSVTAGGANFSGLSPASLLTVTSSEANLTLNGDLTTLGNLNLAGNDLQTVANAKAKAATIQFSTTFGIGTDSAPFKTETSSLAAANSRAGGLAPIHIENFAPLSLGSVHQLDSTNTGSINILNHGGMTLVDGASVVTQGAGSIALGTLSPLTVNGNVTTDAGNISLEAGNGGLMTIGPDAHVTSSSGNIGLVAGDIVNNGAVSTGSGSINVAAATVTGGGSFAGGGGVSGLPTPPPAGPPPPATVSQCVADPSLPDCAAIVKKAFDACLLVPTGPDCALVLPSLPACTKDNTLPGCSVVLPSLPSCIADKSLPGCSAVLPSLPSCVADKSLPGCGAVLPPIQSCIADKTQAGCSVVLPPVQTCIADKTVLGCTVVLPALPTCVSDKTVPGCSVVLPSLPQCIADKSMPGCSVVLPSFQMCVADKTVPGCVVVLPSLTACVADKNIAGCSVILPTIAQCIASPAQVGCAVVLPTLAQCIADPALAGCAAVLPTLAQCVSNAGLPGCSAVLPSLSQCIATPSRSGCSSVLPTLAQCVASPTLQGCSVVLPPVSACVANPTAPGCVVVVPPLQPTPGSALEGAIKTTVTTLNASTNSVLPPDAGAKVADKKDDKKDDKDSQSVKLPGEKSENRLKTYCN